MAIEVLNTEITDLLTAQPVDWLLANVGDKLLITQSFRVEEKVVASSGNPITINDTDGHVGGNWVTDPANRFVNFQVGDQVVVGNYVTFVDHGTATITDKNGNGAIQLSTTFGFGNDITNAQFIVSLATPITAIRYRYNFIENQEGVNFFSKVDGSEQLLVIESISASNPAIVPMNFIGPKTYQIGAANIQGAGITNTYRYYSEFVIYFITHVTPTMLASQLVDAQNNIAPLYFQNQSCLKYVYKIDALYNYTDPNRLLTLTESSIEGNSGWFDENFNTGQPTNYFIDDVNYYRLDFPILVPISALQLTQTQQLVSITVKNTTDAPFVNGQTKFVLNFCKCPVDESEYQGPTGAAASRTMLENFVIDRAQSTLGASAVQGELFTAMGSGMRVLKDVVGYFISPTEIRVDAAVLFGNDSYGIVNESSTPTYLFWVTIADHTLATDESDKVNLRVGPDEYFIDTSDPGMIQIQNIFLRHWEDDPDTQGVSDPTVFPTDDVAPVGQFYIDRAGRENDDISIKSVTMRVKAKNSVTLDEVILDTHTADFTAAMIVGGYQQINQVIPRGFHIPTAEDIRKNIVVERRADLDTSSKFYYGCNYPFLVRWMYWEPQGDNNGDFYNPTEPLNGLNQYWQRYGTIANWGVYYEIKVLATKNGVLQQYVYEQEIIINNYRSNPDWTNETIKSYDPDTLVELLGGGIRYLLGYKNTLVESRFQYVGLSAPVLGDIATRFWIEVFEQGGIYGARRYSSVWPGGSDTWFIAIDASDMIVNTSVLPALTIASQALVDYLQLPAGATKYTIYARIYDKREPVGGMCGINSRRQEDGVCRILEDGNERNME